MTDQQTIRGRHDGLLILFIADVFLGVDFLVLYFGSMPSRDKIIISIFLSIVCLVGYGWSVLRFLVKYLRVSGLSRVEQLCFGLHIAPVATLLIPTAIAQILKLSYGDKYYPFPFIIACVLLGFLFSSALLSILLPDKGRFAGGDWPFKASFALGILATAVIYIWYLGVQYLYGLGITMVFFLIEALPYIFKKLKQRTK